MHRPPLIGITAGNDPQMPDHYVLRWDYVHSIAAAGGVPVILAPSAASEQQGYVESFHGLVLSGGSDISPDLYGRSPDATIRTPSRERDDFELFLAHRALELGVPVLGICRGMQLLNVALGGTLIQDLPSQVGHDIQHDDLSRPRPVLVHDVDLVADSRIIGIVGAPRLTVNSFHHQAIDRLAEGLVATGHSPDGVIEAVEMAERPFVVGVQWHPECFWNQGAPFLTLFEELVARARSC